MGDSYFVITNGDDGVDVAGPFTADELLLKLELDGDGYHWWGQRTAVRRPPTRMAALGDGEMVILKGEVVVPRPVEVVKKWELP